MLFTISMSELTSIPHLSRTLGGDHPLTGVNNVKATDRRSRYGSDGAQSCA